MNNEKPTAFYTLLQEMEATLLSERDALRRLDREEIERLSERKLQIDGDLRLAVDGYEPRDADRELLTRIRFAAHVNQLLLVHARNCVQGVIGLFTGERSASVRGLGTVPPAAVAVNIKG